MLASAFVFLIGIGPATERGLWQNSTANWTAFLERPSSPSISSTRKSWYDETVATAQSQLAAGQADFSLDIETTDLSAREGLVTGVELCRNPSMRPS
jgi:uncharacterized protein